ncbi:septum formation initiator family protein [Patescibacteria group bacterium]|nr:septum formation initiator family protein [Patescibacteria group bacterium]
MKKRDSSKLKRFFGSRLFLMLALIFAIIVAFGYARAYYQDYKIRQEIRLLQEEVKHLEHKKLDSLEILKYVTSPAFVEEKARTELNLKKPGENVIVINGQFNEEENELNDPVEKQVLNNPIKWWYYFTKHYIN